MDELGLEFGTFENRFYNLRTSTRVILSAGTACRVIFDSIFKALNVFIMNLFDGSIVASPFSGSDAPKNSVVSSLK